jgi:FkbM family methyltransferase
MLTHTAISYAQRYEDMVLLHALGEHSNGFYIDVGAGHPVYDNVSFAFYLRGWRGITIEPNAWLTQLSRAVRPRDVHVQALVGNSAGEATYYLVEHYHGLSTTIHDHAEAARATLGRPFQRMQLPVTTLRILCDRCVPTEIDFLKIDVEGAEFPVLQGADWQRFRPRIVVAEALTPLTMEPAWMNWDALLIENDYTFALFDGLNRYYVANEHAALADRAAAPPSSFEDIAKFSDFKSAAEDKRHPDHALAQLLSGLDMIRLPLISRDILVDRLLIGVSDCDRRIGAGDVEATYTRLFGTAIRTGWTTGLGLTPAATVCDLYRSAVDSEDFRVACGRISASSAW